MLNYIIIEDNLINYIKIKDFIDNYMMNYDYNYIVQNHQDIKDDTGFKIYYVSNNYYIEEIKQIREKDWSSLIYLIKPTHIEPNLHISDIIIHNKNTFIKTLNISISIYNSHPKYLSYIYKNIIYRIPLKDILYIEKEYDSKHCIIYTKMNTYITTSSITELQKYLDNKFIKTSRSTIININHIKEYHIKENTIILTNNSIYNSISKSKKTILISLLRKV